MAKYVYSLQPGKYPRLVIEYIDSKVIIIHIRANMSFERRDTELVVFYLHRVEHFPLVTIRRYAMVDSVEAPERAPDEWTMRVMDNTDQALDNSAAMSDTYLRTMGKITKSGTITGSFHPRSSDAFTETIPRIPISEFHVAEYAEHKANGGTSYTQCTKPESCFFCQDPATREYHRTTPPWKISYKPQPGPPPTDYPNAMWNGAQWFDFRDGYWVPVTDYPPRPAHDCVDPHCPFV